MSLIMEIIKINRKEYYLASDVYNNNKSFFPKCSKSIRNIIKIKNLKKSDYVFARYSKKDGYIKSNKKYLRARLLLCKKWCYENLKDIYISDFMVRIICNVLSKICFIGRGYNIVIYL